MKKSSWKKYGQAVVAFLEDEPQAGEPLYDPAHVAAVIIGCMAAIGILYWLLWALLVCEGGLPSKVMPFLQVVFTAKRLGDYGYVGYPYELGLFEGWIVNLGALVIGLALLAGGWWVFQAPKARRPGVKR